MKRTPHIVKYALTCIFILEIHIFQASGQEKPISKFSILFGGDFSFAETYQEKLESRGKENILKTKGYEYSLFKIGSLLKNSDQVIANLETPLTDITQSGLSEKNKYRIHKGDIFNTTAMMKKYNITAVSLANNHTLDYGRAGLIETLKVLKDNSIDYFGAGKNKEEAGLPYIISQNIGSKKEIIILGGLDYIKKYDSLYHFYATQDSAGVNSWKEKNLIEQIKSARSKNKSALLIAYPHWLANYVWKTKSETSLAHKMIDAGADMVIGHGTHMFQEIEYYKNKWIIYSLGNLMFNAPGRYQKKKAHPYSFIISVEYSGTEDNVMNLNLYPILSDNLKTNYQPRFLKESEAKKVLHLLSEHSVNFNPAYYFELLKNNIGYYISIRLQ